MSKLTKKEKSELARQRAIEEKSKELEKSKGFIQNALSNIDKSTPKSNHVVFSDSDDESDNTNQDVLGLETGDDEDLSFGVSKPHFEGKKGMKLMKQQMSIGNDPRFQITDKRFAIEDEDFDEKDEESEEEEDEKRSNMNILESVVGRKRVQEKTFQKFVDINTRRFDPSKPQMHQKHIQKNDESCEPPKKKKKKKVKAETPMPPQDNKRFTKINYDELKEGFTSEKEEKKVETFSFDNMFDDNNEEKNEETSGQFNMSSMFSNDEQDPSEDERIESMDVDEEMPPQKNFSNFSNFDDNENYDDGYYDDSNDYSATINNRENRSNKYEDKSEVVAQLSALTSKVGVRGMLLCTEEYSAGMQQIAISGDKIDFEQKQARWEANREAFRNDYRKKYKDYKKKSKLQARDLE